MAKNTLTTNDDGRRLAVAMLKAMDDRPDECSMFQSGQGKQDNVALRFLDALRGAGSRDAEIGFSEVLSDFISSNLDGDDGMVRPEAYESNVLPFVGGRAPL